MVSTREPEHGLCDLRMQGFIFTWKDHEDRASALERKLRALLPVAVINSEETLRAAHDGWIHLGESAYFAAQWNHALRLFDGDVLVHIQADADSDEFPAIIERARALFQRSVIGVYEPNVSNTGIQYDRARLRPLGDDLMQVPMTDCTCWFIHGSIVRQFPPFDVSVNTYGWGAARIVSAIARLSGRICVRDYAFTVRHPSHRGYSRQEALRQMQACITTLPAPLRAAVADIVAEREAIEASRRLTVRA